MSIERILANQNIVGKRKRKTPVIALAVALASAIATGTIMYANVIPKKPQAQERMIDSRGKEIKINVDGKIENFVFSPEIVKENELNHGIVVWEKISKSEYNGRKISYPTGHLYVFKDINTRKIVGKFAVSGGILENDVTSIVNEIYVLNKFESWPDFVDDTGKIIFNGRDLKNPWGYGRFYHYPIDENGKIMEILSKKSFKRFIYPDKNQRYLHADALLNEGIKDYEKNKKELSETNFQPTRTIGCTKTSNYAMDFLEERINPGYFRLAYVNNIR